uniref:Uncharacterized protein n=1 Tax=Lotus japonicus TaxID=34305 RepID=I3T5A7_LOTJA|nr:unknown [Lotus japonicus]
MVFSCLVKGVETIFAFSSRVVQARINTKPSKAAETLRLGTKPVVRFSFITMTLYMMPIRKLVISPLIVICSLHGAILLTSSASTTIFSMSSLS